MTTTQAKVDYLKPLEGIPYPEVQKKKDEYREGLYTALQEIVGEQNLRIDTETLQCYAADRSLEQAGGPAAVVFPETTEQVCKIVAYANDRAVPVVPASSGVHNYGAVLPGMGGIVVDLSGWKTIHKIDRRNRAVRIAPGITYGELQEQLAPEGLRALTPLLPRKEQSVLTAHLEAHPMLIPEFNYSEPVYTAEIVMPTGSVFRTGTAAVAPPEQNQSDMIGPWGPGFDWNRLYTRAQGTLGIVTWMNIMAEPLPRKQKLYFTCSRSMQDLVSFTYRVQRKWIGYECFILNRANLASILARDDAEMALLRRNLPEYVQLFCIGGLKRYPDERIAYQERDFLAVSQECGMNPRSTIPEAPRAATFFNRNLRNCWGGEVYWKERARGGSADIFFVTTMESAPSFIRSMQEAAVAENYNVQDIGVYLQPIENGRAAHLEFSIPFNPDDSCECDDVRRLHRTASERLFREGALFTRAYGSWGSMVAARNAMQYQTSKAVKEIIDPNCIMNPGKLGL